MYELRIRVISLVFCESQIKELVRMASNGRIFSK